MRVLVVNTGSSSTKLRLVEPDDAVSWSADLPVLAIDGDETGGGPLADALARVPPPVGAVAHRVVHGGTRFDGPALLDEDVERAVGRLAALAPLHQDRALAAIHLARRAFPGTAHVVCFDTAFHTTMPPAAATYAVPQAWRQELGVRRYGFHGLSHAYAGRRAAAMLGRHRVRRTVTCHLGAGASLAALSDGRSVDTTMGFTPLEGLVMATRSGTVDPGLVPWLVRQAGLDLDEVADALEHDSGIAALAGTPDMAAVTQRAERGEEPATLALSVYVHRLRAGIAAMAGALGGLDAVVFTGGVGERSPAVRGGAAAGLGFLGMALDDTANTRAVPDTDIAAGDAGVRTLVVAAREELQMAAEARALLG